MAPIDLLKLDQGVKLSVTRRGVNGKDGNLISRHVTSILPKNTISYLTYLQCPTIPRPSRGNITALFAL